MCYICGMKKIFNNMLLWYYRRQLRRYFLLYVRKGCTIENAVAYAAAIVDWIKWFGNIKSLSSLDELVKIADECQLPPPPPI